MTTAMPPDPDPTGDSDLEPGGGVRPGSTPPDSGSAASALTHHEHDGPRKMGPIVIVVCVVVAVLVGVLVVVAALGRLG